MLIVTIRVSVVDTGDSEIPQTAPRLARKQPSLAPKVQYSQEYLYTEKAMHYITFVTPHKKSLTSNFKFLVSSSFL